MAKNTIKLKDYLHMVEEYPANAAITPGMLVELSVNSSNEPVVVTHSTEAGKPAPVMIATEDEFQGKTIDDAYAAGEPVQCWIPQRGDVFYGILADGEAVSIGDLLVSKGDGKLRAFSSSDDEAAVVGVALEDVDMSGSSAEDPSGRIIVRVV